MFLLVDVLFKLEAGGLKFTKRGDRKSCKVCIAINKGTIGSKTEAQRSKACRILHTQQEIPLCQSARAPPFLSCTRVLTPLHQHASPAVR